MSRNNTLSRHTRTGFGIAAGILIAVVPWTTLVAQQTPLTGRMLSTPHAASPVPKTPQSTTATTDTTRHLDALAPPPPATAPPAPTDPMPEYTNLRTPLEGSAPPLPDATEAGPPPTEFGTPIGPATQRLLRMQSSNIHAAPPRPMLGDEASAAYKRYLDSFSHPIPEFFQTEVDTSSQGSGQ